MSVRPCLLSAAALALVASSPSFAISLDWLDGEISGTLNTTVTFGAAMRLEKPAADLIGKADLNPELCARQYQSCQGLFRDQVYPSQRLVAAPGQFAMRADDGNLNYGRFDLIQTVGKVTQDLTLNWEGLGFFAKWLYFYDFTNNNFTETHPDLITRGNADQVGFTNDPIANRYFPHVYGPGASVRSKRNDGSTLRQIGTALQLHELNVFGKLPLPFLGDQELSFKIGRQTVNWGESTLLAINSINQANPVNANNLFRVGTQVEEVFMPVGMVFASIEPFSSATIEAFYQFEWQPLDAPPPGSYFATNDLGTRNAGASVNYSFGAVADDPEHAWGGPTDNTRKGYMDNPLALITPTTGTWRRERDMDASSQGQFGLAFKYYAEELGSGTEFGLYFMNYHSKLPYISMFAAPTACSHQRSVTNTVTFFQACPNIPATANAQARQQLQVDTLSLVANQLLVNPVGLASDLGVTNLADLPATLTTLQGLLLGGNPDAPLSDAAELDQPRVVFEYPENIQLYGFSFNTTYGDYSFQGEVAYRPNLPLQIAVTDLGFAALGPTLNSCGNAPDGGCAGTHSGLGWAADGSRTVYGGSDFQDASGSNPYPDTLSLVVGHLPGSARAYPSFVTAYRGGVVGENPGSDPGRRYDRHNPGYIRGYERFDVFQFDVSTTRVLGATENYLAADQVQLVAELGAEWIPGLPSLDRLQIDAPGQFLHASAGADGSGADGSRQACSTNSACNAGADGLRFNPHQANLKGYSDALSYGYRIIMIVKYESVLPAISLQPSLIWGHDVKGTAPGPAENFIANRKQLISNLETRYKDFLSFNIGYVAFMGGGANNLLRDRDFAQAFVKLQF
ncbi:Protein of unknown function [Solimonas aquatica]|uniref:DUF1302 domain-containing protein n=1 Tax=Solimonas aquatica TaxID=489703 RepID=A0A1H9D1E5_9GAMM|nr:DUF1302 family protein [Solimonas aquatica]SEQ07285.1 Protein of unknown function [Solimonas aquatica]